MKSLRDKSRLLVKKGGDLPLSGQAMSELMKVVFEKGASLSFAAKGFSMFPNIREGDRITVSSLKSPQIGIGVVVAYTHPKTQKFAVHRVIKRKGRSYLIKGDNNLSPDGLIPRSNIQGYLAKLEREGRRISFGLGPERIVIALFNRSPSLHSLLVRLQTFLSRPLWMRSKR